MKLRIFIVVFLTGLSTSLFAQGKLSEEKRKEFEAQKVAYFTQVLDLTPQEAAVFWPLYNEMIKKLREQEKLHRKDSGKFNQDRTLTATEAKNQTDAYFQHEQKMLDIKKEYYQKLMRVIPVRKVCQLEKAERKFHRQLFDRMCKTPEKKQ